MIHMRFIDKAPNDGSHSLLAGINEFAESAIEALGGGTLESVSEL